MREEYNTLTRACSSMVRAQSLYLCGSWFESRQAHQRNMEKNSETGKWYYDVWGNGKYFDLWSVNHILAGCVIVGPLYAFSVPFIYSLAISIILIAGWEVYEVVYDIKETWQNRTTDILTGIIGFLVLWDLYQYWTRNIQFWVYLFLLIVWLVLEIWGYLAYKATTVKK